MTDGPTTDRAQRQQAVASGEATTAVDRLSPRSNPGSGVVEGTSRSRQIDAQRRIADDIGADPSGVATTAQRGGINAYLRSSGARDFAQMLRDRFAGAADFVTERDVSADIDRQAISGAAQVARDRRDDVADRARTETASDTEFVRASDLDADVGARGVTGLEVAPDRRDDVAERTREGLASEDPFAQPSDFEANVSAAGIETAGLTDQGAERRASRQFEAETPLQDVGTDDVTDTGSGFGLDTEAQRRVAARQFEGDIGLFESGELDPSSDIRETDSGFGLSEEPAREVAAAELSDQVDGSVDPNDVTLEETDTGGFEAVFEREVTR